MLRSIRSRLSYANVMATIAVFIALGLGTAWAATGLEKNQVKSKHIGAGQVKNSDLGSDSVTSPKVADGSLLNEDFANGQLPSGPQGEQGLQGPAGSPDSPQQVREKLSQVDGPGSGLDADTLDGLGSGALVNGSGRLLHGSLSLTPPFTGTPDILTIPGFGDVEAQVCTPSATAANRRADAQFTNGSGVLEHFWQDGGAVATQSRGVLAGNGSGRFIGFLGNGDAGANEIARAFVVRSDTGASVEITVAKITDATDCEYFVQALVSE
jgi:hypothetical protein